MHRLLFLYVFEMHPKLAKRGHFAYNIANLDFGPYSRVVVPIIFILTNSFESQSLLPTAIPR